MVQHDTYMLQRLDDLVARINGVEAAQTNRIEQSAGWRAKLSADMVTLQKDMEGVTKWQEATEKRARQALYGVGIVALAIVSRAPKDNIEGLTGILEALKGFLTALSGI